MIGFDQLPGFGIEVRGVDLARPLLDAEFAELERAFYANHVLALRGGTSTPHASSSSRGASAHPSRT